MQDVHEYWRSILIITDRYREKTGYCSLVIFREVFFVSKITENRESSDINLDKFMSLW